MMAVVNRQIPTQCVAFKGIVSQVKQIMMVLLANRCQLSPILRAFTKPKVANDLIKLSPFRREPAESALAQIPPLIIHCAQSISGASMKSQHSDIAGLKSREYKRIQQERQESRRAIHKHLWIGHIGVRIPVGIQSPKPSHSNDNTKSIAVNNSLCRTALSFAGIIAPLGNRCHSAAFLTAP